MSDQPANSDFRDGKYQDLDEKPARSWPWGQIILGIGVAASLATALFLHAGMLSLRMETQTLARELAGIRQTLAVSDVSNTQSLAEMKAALDATKQAAISSAESTRVEARRAARAVASGISKSSKQMAEQQAEQNKQFEMKLTAVQNEAREASTKLTDITSEVSTVKTDVASTRTDLDRTISDLRRTTGDLGVMSGLIATNSRELQALKELGEKDYFEFTLTKTKNPQKVGDIQVVVKKTDPKKNRFTLEILADDKKVEKKDKNLNEPVQFYVTSKARQPYELVVNEVRKDQVVGYLAVPKVKGIRRNEGD